MFRALNPLKPQAVRKSLLETSDAWVPLGSVSIALHRQDDVPLRKLARQHSKAGECRRVLSPLIQPLFLSFPRQPAALKLFLFHLLHNANSCQFLLFQWLSSCFSWCYGGNARLVLRRDTSHLMLIICMMPIRAASGLELNIQAPTLWHHGHGSGRNPCGPP